MFKEPFAVRLTNVSKNYMVYAKPRYWLADFLGLGRLLQENKHYRSFWALRDINLEIPAGGKYALVGRNGAGKSTLLRIISQNILPTSGKVEVNGHVEALMELGTGFKPEFTGRENIYTALAYKGITGKKAEEKFWDIIDFSELDEFIEQPVKTYSSGMYLRLAFSVATVVAPKILIIDEILAAGDMYFQAKCLGRIQELTSGPGTTVIFVSHNLQAAQRLCDTFVWVDRGRIAQIGPSAEVQVAYEDSIRKQQETKLRARNLRLRRQTLSALQATSEDGGHLLGRFVLEASGSKKIIGPHIGAIRLYTRGTLAEEIRVGDAMDDNAGAYPSFIISNPAESSWSSPRRRDDRLTRLVQPDRNGVNGAKFALFLAHDNFTADDFQVELEVVYQDSSTSPCYLELSAGLAGLKRMLSLEHSSDNHWKMARLTIPKWVYVAGGNSNANSIKQKPSTEEAINPELPKAELETEIIQTQATNGATLPEQNFGTKQVVIEQIQFFNEQGEESFIFQHGRPMSILLTYHAQDASLINTPMLWSMTFQRIDGVNAAQMISTIQNQVFTIQPKGKLRMTFDSLLLTNGTYWVYTALFAELDLHAFNQHFTESSALYDMRRKVYQFVIEGSYPMESSVIRHPVHWEALD